MSRAGRTAFMSACFGLLVLTIVRGQQAPEPPRFKVGVDAVRIDAGVTDRDGRIVTDLTAGDFDVRQDGKRQAVTFAEFVPVSAGADPAPGSAIPAPRGASPLAGEPVPPPALKREEVQRTFALVVDDLGLSVESLQNARRALHAFVDRSLRPTDLAAVVRTGGSAGALQSFTTDRRVLHAAIDALHWNGLSRNGVEAFEPVELSVVADSHSTLADPTDFSLITQLRKSMSAAGSLGALNLVVRSARDLPGRRAIVFVSEGFQMMPPELTGPAGAGGVQNRQPDSRLRAALDRVIDQATRAGVVIYSLDSRGLQSAGLQASDNLKVPLPGKSLEETVRIQAADRVEFNRDTQEGLAYVAEQTGGFAVLNSNDLAGGLGRIADDVRGYYVIGYAPRDGTFAGPGEKPRVHKISVEVRRPGLRVKTRKAFIGVSDVAGPVAPDTPARQLVRAATSPFVATDIALHVTTLPGYSPAQGMFVRTLLHVDARALAFVDGEGGKRTAAADVLGMIFDQEGNEVAHLSTGFAVALTAGGAADALREGLAYTLRIPIRQSGGYQVRFAVRDQKSGAIGSAGEFVQIPDMAGGAFALSGISLRPDDGGGARPAGVDLLDTTPAQAIGSYPAGTRLSYAYEIYNASETIRATMTVWRGTERIFAAPPDTLNRPANGGVAFAAAGGFSLGALPPGSYALMVSAVTADPKHAGRSLTAVQRIAFEVRAIERLAR